MQCKNNFKIIENLLRRTTNICKYLQKPQQGTIKNTGEKCSKIELFTFCPNFNPSFQAMLLMKSCETQEHYA